MKPTITLVLMPLELNALMLVHPRKDGRGLTTLFNSDFGEGV